MKRTNFIKELPELEHLVRRERSFSDKGFLDVFSLACGKSKGKQNIAIYIYTFGCTSEVKILRTVENRHMQCFLIQINE